MTKKTIKAEEEREKERCEGKSIRSSDVVFKELEDE